MTQLNPSALNMAAVAFRDSEVAHGSGSVHDNVAAAITAYQHALDGDPEYAASTAVLGMGDAQLQAVQDAIDQRLTGNGDLRAKARTFFDHALCEVLDGFEQHFASDTRWNLDRLVVDKAKLLVDALLRGDEAVLKAFVGWSYQHATRLAVLDAIGDYAARTEVEELRKEVERLQESLRYRGGY